MKNTKSIRLGRSDHFISDLKAALAKLDENKPYVLKLCTEEHQKPTFEVDGLRHLCNNLYNRLLDARQCIEILANEETRTNKNHIYYDKRSGHNGGARDLLEDVNAVLNEYMLTLVQLDLYSDGV